MAKNDVRSAAFSTDGNCLLQSDSGFSPEFVLFPPNLPKRYMLQCRGVGMDNNEGFC